MFRIIHSSPQDTLQFQHIFTTECISSLKSVAITKSDQILMAVGYTNGTIDLFTINDSALKRVQRLMCHKASVNALKFSSYENTSVMILASISEEICFWNVTHLLNNPIEPNSTRYSQRFNRPRFPSTPEVTNNIDAIKINGSQTSNGKGFHNKSNVPMFSDVVAMSNVQSEKAYKNPWCGKSGASDKPELLSCIKFVGNSAEKLYTNHAFDKFITIDNEGEIYYIRINNFQHRI